MHLAYILREMLQDENVFDILYEGETSQRNVGETLIPFFPYLY